MKIIRLFVVAAALTGCVENSVQESSQVPVSRYSQELSSLADKGFSQCVEFAANGSGPNSSTLLSAGFSERKVLGFPVFVRSVSGQNSLFDNQWVSFSFRPKQQSCLFTATNVGGGLWVSASYVRTQLTNAGWKEVDDGSNKKFTYTRGANSIVMSGLSSGGQTQFTLKASNT